MGTICCKAESNGNQLLSLDYSTQIKMTEMPKNNTSKIMGSAKVRSSFSNTIINLDDQKVITQPSPANGKLIVNNRTELNEFSDFKHTKCERSGYKNKLENKVLKFECKEDRKITKPESSILISRVPTNLKVTPSFFRIEKSGKLEDSYNTLGLIGKGGYGEVRKIQDKVTREIRAVKVISKAKCQKTAAFSDEIRILQKIVKLIKNIGSSKHCEIIRFL